MKRLEFMDDLPHRLMRQFADFADFSGRPATWGSIEGLLCTVYHLIKIGEIAMEENNIPILLHLYAAGIIENPVDKLKAAGAWDDRWNDLAETLGAT
jgi:hypothetical protein